MSQRERLARLEEQHRALTARVDNQDQEFKRRLGELNGEHSRIASVVDRTQSQAQAHADVDKVFAKIDANDKAIDLRLKALEGSGRESIGRAVLPNAIWYAVAAAAGAWIWNQLTHR